MGKEDLNKLIKLASQIADENASVYDRQIKKSHVEKDIFRPDSFIKISAGDTGDIKAPESGDSSSSESTKNPTDIKTNPASSGGNKPFSSSGGGSMFGGQIYTNEVVKKAVSQPFNAFEFPTSAEAAYGFYQLLLKDLSLLPQAPKEGEKSESNPPPTPVTVPESSPTVISYNRKRSFVKLAEETPSTIPPTRAPATNPTPGKTSEKELEIQGKQSAGQKINQMINQPDPNVLRAYGLEKPKDKSEGESGFYKFWMANRSRLEKTLFTIEYGMASVGQGGRGGETVVSLFAIGLPKFSVDFAGDEGHPEIAYEMSSKLQVLRVQILTAAFQSKPQKMQSAFQTGFKWWDALTRSLGR